MSEIPTSVLDAIRRADVPDAASPGELWRARDSDGHTASLVLVRSVNGFALTVAPVTFDVEFADDQTYVIAEAISPLGLPLAVHAGSEFALDRNALIDRLGHIDPGDAPDGPPIVSPLDERAALRAALVPTAVGVEADGEWWLLDRDPGPLSQLLLAIHGELADARQAARVVPRPNAIALVSEMDAFVLVMAGEPSVEVARQVLHGDPLLTAVCMAEPTAPFLAVVIDRRDVVNAIETPSGELRPPRRTRDPAPIGEALVKFLDTAISPFGRLAGTVVDAHTLDGRELAVDAAAEAVRAVEASARGFKVEGKRPGYERVGRHKAAIVELIEAALADPEVDVTAFLDDDA